MRGDLRALAGWRLLGVGLLAGQLVLTSALAAERKEAEPAPATTGAASNAPTQVPRDYSAALNALIYVPHDYDAPAVTEAGGARGLKMTSSEAPRVHVLAPPTLAATLSAQPTLYWYLSGPSSGSVRLTLLDFDDSRPEPLLEVDLGPVPAAGIYGASLAEHDVQLEQGRRYEWSVAVQVSPDAYSDEPVAKTVLAAGAPDPTLLAKIEGAPALARLEALAAAGYWYDTIDLLAQQIAAKDTSQPWRELRAGLLEQVGLQAVAAFERADGQAQ